MIELLKKYILKKYNTISFDIFDTLIERDVDTPSDIFYIVGSYILGVKNADQFRNDRINAEKKARQLKTNGEVNLNDIYLNLPKKYDKCRDELFNTEIETEIRMCHAKKNMNLFYNEMVNNNKKIFLISDMYLSEKIIKSMLDKCNLHGYKKIYISNEYGINKVSGDLFLKVIDTENIDIKKHLHIGDSIRADLIGAYKAGIHSLHIGRKNRLVRLFHK